MHKDAQNVNKTKPLIVVLFLSVLMILIASYFYFLLDVGDDLATQQYETTIQDTLVNDGAEQTSNESLSSAQVNPPKNTSQEHSQENLQNKPTNPTLQSDNATSQHKTAQSANTNQPTDDSDINDSELTRQIRERNSTMMNISDLVNQIGEGHEVDKIQLYHASAKFVDFVEQGTVSKIDAVNTLSYIKKASPELTTDIDLLIARIEDMP